MAPQTQTPITKAQLAREIGYSRARITQLVDKGLPVRPDGLLDRAKALGWIEKYTSSYGGGWHVRGKGGGGLPERASRALHDESQAFFDGQVTLYEEIRQKLLKLPNILLKLGAPVPIAFASVEMADFLLGEWILEYGPELVQDDSAALPDPDLRELAKLAGLPLHAERWKQQGDAIAERLIALFYPGEKSTQKDRSRQLKENAPEGV